MGLLHTIFPCLKKKKDKSKDNSVSLVNFKDFLFYLKVEINQVENPDVISLFLFFLLRFPSTFIV